MIADHLVQKAIYNKLRNTADLITLMGSSGRITEDQIQTSEFTYPAVRIDLIDQTPDGNAGCRETLSRILFAIIIFSETTSSFQCSNIKNKVVEILFGSQINGTDENDVESFRILKIDLINTPAPQRINERLWRGEALFGSLVHPL